jgi:hypothetical protein
VADNDFGVPIVAHYEVLVKAVVVVCAEKDFSSHDGTVF